MINMVPISIEKITRYNAMRSGKNRKLLEEFLESGQDCVELIGWQDDWKSIESARTSLLGSIKRFHCYTVQIATRKDHLFFIRKK